MGALRVSFPLSAAALAVAAGFCGLTQAFELRQSVSAPLTFDYDTNPALVVGDPASVMRALFSPQYEVTASSARDSLKGTFRLKVERSTDETVGANRNDPAASLEWQRATERGGFGVLARYDRGSTRYSELEETGSTVNEGTRQTSSLAANWNRDVGPRGRLAVDAGYRLVDYDTGIDDYANMNAGASYFFNFRERVKPFLSASFNRFEPRQGPQPASDNSSIQAGVEWQYSEYLDINAKAGGSYTNSIVSDHFWLASTQFNYRAAGFDANLKVGRYVIPSGSQGGFVTTDDVEVGFVRSLDERSSLSMGYLWRDSKGETPNVYQRLRASTTHAFSAFVSLAFELQFKRREEPGLPNANGRFFGVTVTYTDPAF